MDYANTVLTPDFIKGANGVEEIIRYDEAQQNLQGLEMHDYNDTNNTDYISQNPDAIRAREEYRRAMNGGVNFEPPDKRQGLMDMLGGALVGYAASRLLGGDSQEALGVGLTAAAINHDKDKAENDRYGIIKDAIAQNGDIYSQEMLWNFMKTGDGKPMEEVEKLRYQTGNALQQQFHGDLVKQWDYNEANKARHEGYQQAKDVANINSSKARNGSQLVDEDGHLTFHGGNQATSLANAVRQTKAPYVRNLQTRMAKLASAEGAIEKIQEYIQAGDFQSAQALYKTFLDDLAQANKGGNAAITEADKEGLAKIGGILTQWMNEAKVNAGYMPEVETMNAIFNNMKAIQQNDRNALNNEVFSEVNSLGGSVYNPVVVKGAASILMNQAIGNTPASQAATQGAPQAQVNSANATMSVTNKELMSHIGEDTTHPEGYVVSNGNVALVSHNGKWEVE